jgi:elongation factor G
MKVYDTADIRNIALLGHGDCGKTTLASTMLFVSGAVNRLGRVEEGNTITDFDDEEIERKISLQTALAHTEWNKKKINILDTPGYAAFFADARAALTVADGALLVVEGVAGVQVITERAFKFVDEEGLPLIFAVNKLDRERSSAERTLEAIQSRFGRTAVPIQLPLGAEHDFEGVVDLLTLKALKFAKDGSGKMTVEEPDAAMAEKAAEVRSALIEMVAETDDALMETFFEAGDLTDDQLRQGLRKAVAFRKIFPVVYSAALPAIGAQPVLDLAVDLVPSPDERGDAVGTNPKDGSEESRPADRNAPVSVFVFKTMADPYAGRVSLFRVRSGVLKGDTPLTNVNRGHAERAAGISVLQGKQLEAIGELAAGDLGAVAKLKDTHTGDTLADPGHPIQYPGISFPAPAISFAIEPKSKGDEEKISQALLRLTEEDPVLKVGRDPQTGELLVSGTGQVHVEVAFSKMKKKFGVDAILKQPKVPYLETVRKKVGLTEGKHKKQTGGRGQFGVCVIEMEPLPRGEGFEFVDKIFGGSIPQNYRPAVKKGIEESAARGYLAGYPVVDFRVTLVDGKYHNVDSSEMAFKIAGSLAFKAAMERAKPTLMEPIMSVEVVAPEEYMGDIMGDLSSRRGKPQGMESQGGNQVIKAQVPLAEMLSYASTLKSITSDRGTYTMEFDHYEEVPAQVQEKIIADSAKQKQEAEK